jgi:hypothetical protein
MDQLHAIVYVSTATRPLTPAELDDILGSAQTNNQTESLTGLLLHSNGNFMQLLEGPQDALERAMARIKSSSRHHQIIEFMREPIARREFSGWSMALSQATAPQFLALRDASWKVVVDVDGQSQEPVGRELLRQFWQNTR